MVEVSLFVLGSPARCASIVMATVELSWVKIPRPAVGEETAGGGMCASRDEGSGSSPAEDGMRLRTGPFGRA